MSQKRKAEEITETPSANPDLNLVVYKYLSTSGFGDAAKSFAKEAKVDVKSAKLDSVKNLKDIYGSSAPASKNGVISAKKSKVESSSDTSDDSSSDDDMDSSSEDERPVPAKAAPTKPAPQSATKQAATPASAKATPAKKAAESSSDDSSSSDSDSDDSSSSDDEPVSKPVAAKSTPAAKPAPAKATPAATKKQAAESSDSDSDSSSSDSGSDSDDEDEAPVIKKPAAKPVTPAAKPAPLATQTATPASSQGEYRVYVRGLPWAAKEKEVSDFFKAAGKATTVELPLDENGRSSGTAFVKFASKAEYDAALELDGQLWPGTERWLKIVDSSEKSPRKTFEVGPRPEGCNTVFIGNLSWDVTEEIIRETFEAVGPVSQVRFAQDETGNFKGFGHVEFVDGEHTVEAVKLAGSMVSGRPIRVDYAPPRNRESSGGGRGAGGGGFGRGDRGGRGGRGGGRGAGGRGGASPNKNKGSIAFGGANNKKVKFGEDDDE